LTLGELTLQRRETTVHDQLEIAELALGEDDGGEGLGLGGEQVVAGSIAGEQVLQDTTVRRVGHDVIWKRVGEWRRRMTRIGQVEWSKRNERTFEMFPGRIIYNPERQTRRGRGMKGRKREEKNRNKEQE
jgi:hypothetical protein